MSQQSLPVTRRSSGFQISPLPLIGKKRSADFGLRFGTVDVTPAYFQCVSCRQSRDMAPRGLTLPPAGFLRMALSGQPGADYQAQEGHSAGSQGPVVSGIHLDFVPY